MLKKREFKFRHDLLCIFLLSLFPLLFFSCGKGAEAPLSDSALNADSVAYYTMLLEEMPDSAVVHYNRAVHLFRLRRYKDAISGFSDALQRDPGLHPAYKARGDCQRLLGNYTAAIGDYDAYINATGDGEYSYSVRAWCHFRLENYDKASEDYSCLLVYDTANAEAWRMRGRARYFLRNYAGASYDLQKAIGTGDTATITHIWLGDAFYKQGLLDESISSYLVAAEKKADMTKAPLMARAYLDRADSALGRNNAKALEDLNACIELDPKIGNAYYLRGIIIAAEQGDTANACADFQRAGELGVLDAFVEMRMICPK